MDYNMGYYDDMTNGYAPRQMNRGGYSEMNNGRPSRYDDDQGRYRDERPARDNRDRRAPRRDEEDAAARHRDNRRSRDVPASRRPSGRGPMPPRDGGYNMPPRDNGYNMPPRDGAMIPDNMLANMNSNQNLWDNFLDMGNPMGYTDGSAGPYSRPEYSNGSHRMAPYPQGSGSMAAMHRDPYPAAGRGWDMDRPRCPAEAEARRRGPAYRDQMDSDMYYRR